MVPRQHSSELISISQGEMDIPSREDEADIVKLRQLINSLLEQPPKDRRELEDRYEHITTLIRRAEGRRHRTELLNDLLSSLETDFQRVRRTYSYLSPGFLDEVGTSLLATEYRYFVGGLEIYLAKLTGIGKEVSAHSPA